jgi:hypothetical protein
MHKVKLLCVIGFLVFGIAILLTDNPMVPEAGAYSTGPPPGHTGAPGELTCTECHFQHSGPGQFHIIAPETYTPGHTYQIQVQHMTIDDTRIRWGFQLTALANFTPAGTFADTTGLTQLMFGAGSRVYIEHTQPGTFFGQQGGAQWTFNWVAPAEDLGAVTFYAAGNQANGDGTNGGDQIYTAVASSQPAGGTPSPTATPTLTPTATPTATPTSTPPTATHAAFDYDGDHRCDISVYRPSAGAWYIQGSSIGLSGVSFGVSTDRITPADFDGDGKTDVAVYRPDTGIWYVLNSSDGTVTYHVFGIAEDLPSPADYDGDGRADISVYRQSTGTWYRQNSSDGSFFAIQFGASEDKPTVGDFDDDGRADIAIFRPLVGAWYEIHSSDGSVAGEQFGFGTDVIAPADYDGDGKTDLAVFRPSNGFWYVRDSNGPIYTAFPFGLPEDIPAPGDFDGDGRADLSVFRPSDGTWYRMNSSDGSFFAFQFGANGDKPTQTAFRY